MRLAQRKKNGQWYMVEQVRGISHIRPVRWGMDRKGYWPRLDFVIHDLEETVCCPSCQKAVRLEEMDCVFGLAARAGCDVIFLLRCLRCKLPIRIRVKGLVNAYPYITERMEGWASWEKRKKEFEQTEIKLYGELCQPP